MTTDYTELRRRAERATAGEWRFSEDEERIVAPDGSTIVYAIELEGDDAQYLAAAHPQTILALLDELDRLRAVRETEG